MSANSSSIAIKALEVPEITTLVAPYLERIDRLHCIQVSRSWYSFFLPTLWETVRLSFQGLGQGKDSPCPEVLRKYSHLIKHLTFRDGILEEHEDVEFPNLSRLRVLQLYQSQERLISLLSRLVQGYPSLSPHLSHILDPAPLRQLELRDRPTDLIHGTELLSRCWEVMVQLKCLTSLRLYEVTVRKHTDMESLWKICQQLEHLDLVNTTLLPIPTVVNGSGGGGREGGGVTLSIVESEVDAETGTLLTGTEEEEDKASEKVNPWTNQAVLTTMLFPKIKDLRIAMERRMMALEQLDWIRRCPSLKGLRWSIARKMGKMALGEFSVLVNAHTWPDLQDLDIANASATEQQWSTIIRGMKQVRKWIVPQTSWKPLVLAAFRPHFAGLQKLDISLHGMKFTLYLPELLGACPQLEYLCAHRVSACDIVNGPPWACNASLKHLELHFDIPQYMTTEEIRNVEQEVFGRLSRLKNLRVLDVGSKDVWYIVTERGILDFRLDFRLERGGLTQLKTLTKLRQLGVGYLGSQRMGEQEVRWMLEHWKDLEIVDGCLNRDIEVAYQLRVMLEAANVIVS
ncbi:hypothetical protein EDD11_001981 [Mortierella claussenii]|nr:hypothetical protein EDD11_001981 [Mortierella claussenii]